MGDNLLKMKMLAFHRTELCSQSPATLSKQNVTRPERKDVILLHDSVTGRTGFKAHAHFTSVACLDRDQSSPGHLKQVLQNQNQLQILTRV